MARPKVYTIQLTDDDCSKKVNKENHPLATLVVGQPGSRKSELSKFIQSKNKDTIIIDGDFIREYHPNLREIKRMAKKTNCEAIRRTVIRKNI